MDTPTRINQDADSEKSDGTSSPPVGWSAGSQYSVPVDGKIRRKVDFNVIPLIALLYLCSFLDRGNIGNAKVAGMAKDLNLIGMRYQLCAAMFFIPYSLMQIPCNVLLKLLRPSIWIPSIMVSWGIVMLSMAFVKNYKGLLIARVILGFTEAGLPPGVAFYITLWYRRADQARPISLYFSSATIAGAFGGFLAFALEKLNGKGGLPGWAWIFLVEGILTIIIAGFAFWFMPDSPADAKFLSPAEKDHLVDVLRRDNAGEPSHFEMRFVWETLRSPLSWLITAVYVGMLMPLYAFSLFLPTIINDLGFSASNAQLMTVPPYVCGCICTIGFGILSDRLKRRGVFVMVCSFLGIVGYAMLYATSPKSFPGVGYAGSILAACGVYPTVPLLLAWGSGNAGSSLKKAVIIGLMSGMGNLAGICSSFIYRTKDAPRFHLGHGIVIGFLCMAFVCAGLAIFVYDRLNKAKDEEVVRDQIDPNTKDEYENLGCDSPLFRYSL